MRPHISTSKGSYRSWKKILKVWMMMMKEGIFVGHPFLALPPSTLPQLPLPHFLLHLHSPRSPSPHSALAPLAPVNPTWRPCGPRSSAGLEALQAWRPCRPGGPAGLEDLQAWRPWRPCGPGGPSDLSLPPTNLTTILLGGSESCFDPVS